MARRVWVKRMVALGVSSLAVLVVAELVVRAKFGAPYPERLPLMEVRANPVRGWEMIPSSEHFTYMHKVRVNNLGLRGADVGTKAPGETRVLALGDSMIYGQGVADDDTLPFQLERALGATAAARDWRVINGGLRGYSTVHELGLLQELHDRIDPDAVILFWYYNDLSTVDLAATFAKLQASGQVVFDTGERMEGAVLSHWKRRQWLRSSALIMKLHDTWRDLHYKPPAEDYYDQGLARVRTHMQTFRELSSSLGFRPIVAVVPNYIALGKAQHPTRQINAAVLAICRELDLPCVDLSAPVDRLRQSTGKSPVIPYDGHFLGEANQAMARDLAPRVAEAAAVGGPPGK